MEGRTCTKCLSFKLWEDFPKKLYIDHCHTTGTVRGLICQQCNTLLGMAKDSIPTLENAIVYLRKEYG